MKKVLLTICTLGIYAIVSKMKNKDGASGVQNSNSVLSTPADTAPAPTAETPAETDTSAATPEPNPTPEPTPEEAPVADSGMAQPPAESAPVATEPASAPTDSTTPPTNPV